MEREIRGEREGVETRRGREVREVGGVGDGKASRSLHSHTVSPISPPVSASGRGLSNRLTAGAHRQGPRGGRV